MIKKTRLQVILNVVLGCVLVMIGLGFINWISGAEWRVFLLVSVKGFIGVLACGAGLVTIACSEE